MIHSRKKSPEEIFEFCERFREKDPVTPIVVVPTSFNTVTEEEFAQRGINIVIYANQLTRSAFPAMQKAARTILENHRAKEADDLCMPIKDILTLIPEEHNMGIAVKPLCSTEILFLSLTEMKQRLLSLPVENVLLIMGKEAADWWSLHSFLKEMEDRYQFHWLQTEVANPNQQDVKEALESLAPNRWMPS